MPRTRTELERAAAEAWLDTHQLGRGMARVQACATRSDRR